MSMNLYTNNLELRPLSISELNGNYVSWLNDKVVCEFNSHGESLYTEEMALSYIRSLVDDETKKVFAVYHIKDGIHIGNISLQSIDRKNNSAEIAYLFGERGYWGKGYATEASKVLLNYAFEDLKLHRIYFGTSEKNIPMQKVGEKLGFVKEGRLKDAQLKRGVYNDIILYGKTKG